MRVFSNAVWNFTGAWSDNSACSVTSFLDSAKLPQPIMRFVNFVVLKRFICLIYRKNMMK